MTWIKTKRQRRETLLRKWTDAKWSSLPEFLVPSLPFFIVSGSESDRLERSQREYERVAKQTATPEQRNSLILEWLDLAEKDTDFAKQLDRHLELPTDAEVEERRKTLVIWLGVAAFGLTGILGLAWKVFDRVSPPARTGAGATDDPEATARLDRMNFDALESVREGFVDALTICVNRASKDGSSDDNKRTAYEDIATVKSAFAVTFGAALSEYRSIGVLLDVDEKLKASIYNDTDFILKQIDLGRQGKSPDWEAVDGRIRTIDASTKVLCRRLKAQVQNFRAKGG